MNIGGPVPLLGRTAEVSVLDRSIEGLLGGRGAVVLVEGEAGVGKTRLVGHALERAATGGARVFEGAGAVLDTRRPFGLIADCLGLDQGAPDPRRLELARLLSGEAGAGLAAGTPSAAEVELRATESVLGYLADLCARTPIVVAVDDLQWADPATLTVLHRLGRMLPQHPVLLLCSYRPQPRPPLLDELLASLARRGARQLVVRPLEDDAVVALVSRLVGAAPGPRLLAHVRAAGGNPFFITELVATLAREGAVAVDDGVAESTANAVPQSLRLTIIRRLSFLSPETLQLLRIASLLGPTFSVANLSLVARRAAVELLADLRSALDAGVLGEAGDRLTFRHDLIQEALYQDLPLALRASLHLEAAHTLAGAGAPAGQVAEHFLRGAGPGDVHAVEWLRKAAADASPRAPAVAVDLLERAIELATGSSPIRDQLLSELAVNQAAAGRTADAERTCREVLGRAHDPSVDAALRVCLTQSLLGSGKATEAVREVEEATGLPSLDEADRTRFEAWASVAHVAMGSFAAAVEHAERTRAMAEARGDSLSSCMALATLSGVAGLQGRYTEAVRLARQAVAIADGSDARHAHWFPLHLFLATFLMDVDQRDEARASIRRGLELSEELGAKGNVVSYHCLAALADYLDGRWDDAVTAYDTALEVADQMGVRHTVLFAHCLRALIALHRGDLQAAKTAVEAAQREFAETGPQYRVVWMMWAGGLLQEATGNVPMALALLSNAWNMSAGAGMDSELPFLGPDLVRLGVAAGQRDLAEQACAAVEEVAARNPGVASVEGSARRCRGLLEDDLDALAQALAAYRRGPRPFELAMTCEDLATALAGAGRVGEARRFLAEAVDVYESLAAARAQARAEARLRSFGVRLGSRTPHRREQTGWESLTATETQVAELVSEGLSNPDIAARMFVSRHTVQSHVSHILAKLGLASRVELAAETVRRRAGAGAR